MAPEEDLAVHEIATFLVEWSRRYDRGWVLIFDRPNGNTAVLQSPSTNAKALFEALAARIESPKDVGLIRVPEAGSS